MKRLVLVLLAILAPVVAQGQQSTLPLDHGYLNTYRIMGTISDGDDSLMVQPPFIGGWFWIYAWDEPVSCWFNATVSDTSYTEADSLPVPAATPVAHNIRMYVPGGAVTSETGMKIRLMDAAATNGRVTVVVYPHSGSAQGGP